MKTYPRFSILLVDDESPWIRSMELMLLRNSGINNVLSCCDSREVMSILAKNNIGVVLLDLTMPYIQGNELLKQIKINYPNIYVIIITGINTVDDAVRCMKDGAFDYHVKTEGEERLSTAVLHAIHLAELDQYNHKIARTILDDRLEQAEIFADIITANEKMLHIFRYIEAVSISRNPVLITGESGVGKELIAKALHNIRANQGDFVSVNMASLDGSMLEDTLFGHAKGAFTNAQNSRSGLVAQAQNGTLFLDEIGELSPSSQAKLLRFIQEGEYYPLGSDTKKHLQARIILATNQDLIAKQEDGTFRTDLYYRLKSHHIHIPPLRERIEDIPLLIKHFLEKIAQEYCQPPAQISSEAILTLTKYSFPGNVRELQAMISHALTKNKEFLNLYDFDITFNFTESQKNKLIDEQSLLNFFLNMPNIPSFTDVKNIMTTAALTKTGGNQSAAAKILGISQPAINKRIHS